LKLDFVALVVDDGESRMWRVRRKSEQKERRWCHHFSEWSDPIELNGSAYEIMDGNYHWLF